MKFKLLVIDNELDSRDLVYNYVLEGSGYFELVFARSLQEAINYIGNLDVDGYLIDLWLWENKTAQDFMQLLPSDKPVFLISDYWKKVGSSEDELSKCLDFSGGAKISLILAYKSFDISNVGAYMPSSLAKLSDRQNEVVWQIINCLKKHYKQTVSFKPTSSVKILQLSDLQFGDPHRARVDYEEELIAHKLKLDDNIPDFIALCGDITYSGSPQEFKQAKDWINTFTEAIWSNINVKEKILVVPGNHDMDLRLATCGKYKYDFSTKLLNKVESSDNEYNRIGFQSFREFASEITGNHDYLDSTKCETFVDNRFLSYGLRFIILNSAMSMSNENPQKRELNKNILDKTKKDISFKLTNSENIMTIAIAHHPFACHGSSVENIENYSDFRAYLSLSGVELYMNGHCHEYNAFQLTGEDCLPFFVQSMCSSPHLTGDGIPQDTQRGFNLVKLEKGTKGFEKINIIPYIISRGNVSASSHTSTFNKVIPRK